MKKLYFDYHMQIKYEEPVGTCHFTIKCIPTDTNMQHVEKSDIVLEPENNYSIGRDSFGNNMIYGTVSAPHDYFSYHITGEINVGLMQGEKSSNESMLGMYKYPYGKTVAGNELLKYYDVLKQDVEELKDTSDCSDYDKSIALMHRIYQDFEYKKNVTGIHTTAEEAWKLRQGVCQDYAHIMITLARLMNIPARYVTGMMIGEGFSHAWVEILDGESWYPLDPTNNVIISDTYIKLGVGRDASDCAINRGVLKGGGNQTQMINVIVKEI